MICRGKLVPQLRSPNKSLSTRESIPQLRLLRKSIYVKVAAKPIEVAATWEKISQAAGTDVLDGYTLRQDSKPATAPTATLPTEASSSTDKAVLLYRDTNGWCPYCERVWFALEEKQIDYDVVLIDLRNKPEWYKEIVPTTLVPAIKINGEVVYESYDILMKLEELFPERPLLPVDEALRAEALQQMAGVEEFARAGYTAIRGRAVTNPTEVLTGEELQKARDAFWESLRSVDDALAKHGGPFFLGSAVSLVDVMYMTSMERFRAMPGSPLNTKLDKLPNLARWYAALDAKPAYQKVKSDDYTYTMLFKKVFQGLPVTEEVDEAVQTARREAAAKISANHRVIIADILKNSGLVAVTLQPDADNGNGNGNGHPVTVVSPEEGIESTLQWLCNYLLMGSVGVEQPDKSSAVISAAALAFFHNRASSPRDLSAAAAAELRSACITLIKELY